MDVINRSAVIVMPAEPFLKWLQRADPTSGELNPRRLETGAHDLFASAV